MSVMGLLRFTLVGALADKEALLEALQELGCTHIESLREGMSWRDARPPGDAVEALAFLREAPLPTHREPAANACDLQALQRDALALRERLAALDEERAALARRLRELEPWGDFELPDLRGHAELRFWFYVVPHYLLRQLARTPHRWAVVNRSPRASYVVVIAADEPGLPFARAHTGPRRLAEVRARAAAVELEIDDLQAERTRLARWRDHLADALRGELDREQREVVAQLALEGSQVFAVAGWAPAEAEALMRGFARRQGAALSLEPPASDDNPPTLIEPPRGLAAGTALMSFYLTPGYRAWDPSGWVLASFAAFFALIVSDAGYALLMTMFALLAWRHRAAGTARDFGPALALVCGTAVAWGLFAGSWFGLPPTPGSLAAALALFEFGDAGAMMNLAGVVGAGHLAIASLGRAWHEMPAGAALASFGWALVFGAAMLALGNGALTGGSPPAAGLVLLGTGSALVFAFSGAGGLGERLGTGLLGLARLLSALGDTLSYLRLYALALAGASLATAVNGMAAGLAGAGGWDGALLGGMVLLLGHVLNLVLAVAGGLIHGLRLNFIEFLNWSVSHEGHAFRPFRKLA
jgi:V/A-type H+-transporting ATPase subunit I